MSSKPYSAKDVTLIIGGKKLEGSVEVEPSLPTALDTQQPYTQAEGERRIEEARAFAQAGVTAQAEAMQGRKPGILEGMLYPDTPEHIRDRVRDRIMGEHYDEPEMRDRVMSHYDRLTLRRLERERPHDLGQGVELRPFSWHLKRSRVIEVSENDARMRGLHRPGEYGARYVRISLYVDVLHVDSGEPVEVVVDKTMPYWSPEERAHKIRDMLLEALRHEVDELFFYEGRRLHEPHPEQHWYERGPFDGYKPPPRKLEAVEDVQRALQKRLADALTGSKPDLESMKQVVLEQLDEAVQQGLLPADWSDDMQAKKHEIAALAKIPTDILFPPSREEPSK